MNDLYEKLTAWGCDVAGTRERLLGDEALYLSCLKYVAQDGSFAALGEALRLNDNEQAFDAAHTIKGITANMGLTPMLRIVEEIVESLRRNKGDDLWPRYEELLRENESLKKYIKDYIKP